MTAPAPIPNALATAASAYAAKGLHVFPVVPNGKRPLTSDGFKSATTDAEQVAKWWREHPTANIGCVPGPSGFVVIDLDGPEAEQEAEGLHLLAFPTLIASTGRTDGGRHLWFTRPAGHVPNGKLAAHIDVRGDAGYVILPPSRHPSGALYRWVSKDKAIPLPDDVVPMVLGLATPQLSTLDAPQRTRAAGIPTLEEVTDGGRTNAITSYTGRLLHKGMPADEVMALVLALNARVCKPPLSEDKVRATVASMVATDLRRKPTPVLQLVKENDPAHADEMPTPASLASEQTDAAREMLGRDIGRAVRWTWRDADQMFGPMLPADLVVLGALQGNGKTTLVRAQCDAWERQGVGVLYLPLEVDPAVCRLQWAAARQNLNMAAAVRQEWDRLPEGARECLEVELDHLQASPHLHFVPDKRVTLLSLRKWVEWGIRETKTRVVVVDHFHRLQFGGSAEAYRVAVTEAARQLKDLARDHGLTILATAQLNRSPDLLDAYQAPTIGRIKESAGLAEEADVVLMASRQLKPDLPAHIESQIRRGMASELDAADAGVLRLTCRKHRLDDSARDRFVRLYVEEGRVNGYATARFP